MCADTMGSLKEMKCKCKRIEENMVPVTNEAYYKPTTNFKDLLIKLRWLQGNSRYMYETSALEGAIRLVKDFMKNVTGEDSEGI